MATAVNPAAMRDPGGGSGDRDDESPAMALGGEGRGLLRQPPDRLAAGRTGGVRPLGLSVLGRSVLRAGTVDAGWPGAVLRVGRPA